MISKARKLILKHKFITGICLMLIIAGGYFGYKAVGKGNEAVRYTMAAVERGTLIVSVSGSGQVSASDQVDIKSKVKGEIIAVFAGKGDAVKAGELIARLDNTDYQKAVRDAEISLETAKLELEELLSPPDELTLLKSENTVLQAKNSLEKLKLDQGSGYQKALENIQEAQDDIERAYEDTLNTVTNAFYDLPTIINGLRDVLYSYEIAESETTLSNYDWNISVYQNSFASKDQYELELFLESAISDYETARKNYDKNFENYKKVGYYSEKEKIEYSLNETTETAKSIAQAVKSEVNLLGLVVDYLSNRDRRVYNKITEYQSDLKSYTSKTNSHLSSLLSIQRSLKDSREAKLKAEESLAEMEKTYPLDLKTAEINLQEKEKSLAELKAGPDELDIRAKNNSIRQKEDALLAAEQDVADCNIFVPFSGVITEVKLKKGDSVSAGSALTTLITKQKIAELTLNEIDAAAVKAGQKTTLTFDALPDVSASGEVLEIDTIGQISQGVVSYGMKIAFDTDMEQVKPGMSVTADIITQARPDVLVLPSTAVKSQGNYYYVELVEADEQTSRQLLASVSGAIPPKPPKSQSVEVGLSNDLSTEIVSGLKEGDIVVTSMISPNKVQTTQSGAVQSGGFQIPGMTGGNRQIRGLR